MSNKTNIIDNSTNIIETPTSTKTTNMYVSLDRSEYREPEPIKPEDSKLPPISKEFSGYYRKNINPHIYMSWDLFKKLNHIRSEIDIEELSKQHIPYYKKMDEKTLLENLKKILKPEDYNIQNIENDLLFKIKNMDRMTYQDFDNLKYLKLESLIKLIKAYDSSIESLVGYALCK